MTVCESCGTDLPDRAKFCLECGSAVATVRHAEYKQVTVLFADVVKSMDLAATLDPERLREIMSAVFNRSSAVVQWHGGTVDKFTGDGIMALFGAPVALEDHAVRACLAALDIQEDILRFADEVETTDGVGLRLRIGLNSGQVIAGEIDSGPGGYTVVGQQVGLAQRMESVAPPGGVMLSEHTAVLVEHVFILGEPELVQAKGASGTLPARRLIATAAEQRGGERTDPRLVGRGREIATVTEIMDRAMTGNGSVVGVSGPPGIGKSRIARETAALAKSRGMEVFTTHCESHTNAVPFHAVARLLRDVFGVKDLGGATARARARAILPDVNAEDAALLEDLLGIRDTTVGLPDVNPDARQRRLARLVNTASLARSTPALYIVEDAHWIDAVSDDMLTEFAAAIPQARAMVLVTYRPEYRGAMTRMPNAHKLTLAPLDAAESSMFTGQLVGSDPSVAGLAELISERAAGNPFFAQEIVRDLAERGVLVGERGAFVCPSHPRDVRVPATVQATIAARIDRLDATPKRILLAASVVGARFIDELLADILGNTEPLAASLARLVDAELLEQVISTPRAEYAFCHPLIRTVAYESQLKSDRAELHRRLATAIEKRDPAATEENAALIAEHWDAAGDLHAAFTWHMRAGSWSTYRDIGAAAASWRRARQVADRLPADDPNRLALRIAPRTLLCAHAWRIGGTVEDAGFDELRVLTGAAGDKLSLSIGMAGQLGALSFNNHAAEASQLATECVALIESIGDPGLCVALLTGPMMAKFQVGEASETLRLAQRVIDLADGDATMGNLAVGSPLALALMYRGSAGMCMGKPHFVDDWNQAIATARPIDPACLATAVLCRYVPILLGVCFADDIALRETADALAIAEKSGDHVALATTRLIHGVVLVCRHGRGHDNDRGFELLAEARAMSLNNQFTLTGVDMVDIAVAKAKAAKSEFDEAIELSRAARDRLYRAGDGAWLGTAAYTLVEALLARRADGDVAESAGAIDQLAAVPVEPGFVMNEILLLRCRALLASAHGDETAYQDYVVRYRERATACGYLGHMALAEAMVQELAGQ